MKTKRSLDFQEDIIRKEASRLKQLKQQLFNDVKVSYMSNSKWNKALEIIENYRVQFRIKLFLSSMGTIWVDNLLELEKETLMITNEGVINFLEIEWIEIRTEQYSIMKNDIDIGRMLMDLETLNIVSVASESSIKILGHERKGVNLFSDKLDYERIRSLIHKRSGLHPNDPRIDEYWVKIASILSIDERLTIDFMEQCSEEEIKWIAEVFDDISFNLQSITFIQFIKELRVKFPGLDLSVDIEFAEKMLF